MSHPIQYNFDRNLFRKYSRDNMYSPKDVKLDTSKNCTSIKLCPHLHLQYNMRKVTFNPYTCLPGDIH